MNKSPIHHGKSYLNRIDGPLFMRPDGVWIWYVNGKRIESWEQFKHESGISDEELLMLVLKYGDTGPTKYRTLLYKN